VPMKKKLDIMMIFEGTYPFNGGGVSTWAHILCEKVKNANYTLYSVNANYEEKPKFKLSQSVQKVIQLPMWSPLEPSELEISDKKYYKIVSRKVKEDEAAIVSVFVPIFEKLIQLIFTENANVNEIDATIYQMWRYFQKHDYKKTMKSLPVWKSFQKNSCEIIANDQHYTATLYDLTVAMRWLYRFLMPISIQVPKMDVSHISLSGFPVLPALILKYQYGTPIIATEHGVFIRERLIAINSSEFSFYLKNFLIKFSECITKLAYHKTDVILSVNKFNISWEKRYGANPDKINVVYNGIDHTLFVPAEKPAQLKNTPTVVAAARVFELKDILTMIRSCAVVAKEIPNVKYLIYGDNNAVPEYTKACNALIKELKIEKNFIFAGHHNNPQQLYCEGDISILTSISEGFPYTVIESMSCGIPVVATDVGGVTEALNEDCGMICKPKDHEGIGQSVIKLLKDNELRKKMGLAARERVIAHFTIDKFIRNYEVAYDFAAKAAASEAPNYSNTLLDIARNQQA
jgi:glycosyltransferase involved in cell wall biosynthesis